MRDAMQLLNSVDSSKFIELGNSEYFYSCDHNQLINSEIKKELQKYAVNKNINITHADVTEEGIKKELRNNLKQIVFEITQQCNLRCRYCRYNGSYYYERRPSNKKLGLNIARRTIDYVYGLIKDRSQRSFSIGFYGGEPLLRFDDIKNITDYAEKRYVDWELTFTITTNGTMFNDEIIDYLVLHNFLITVSLDGPKDINDAKRVFPNGRGSYDLIIENLRKIKRKNKKYYLKNVMINAVYSLDMSLMNIYRHFTNNQLMKRNEIKIFPVNPISTDYYKTYPYEKAQVLAEQAEVVSSILKKRRLISEKNLSPFESFLIKDVLKLSQLLGRRNYTSLGAACLFNHKLYVDAGGQYHMCENISDKFPIGNYKNGYDYSRMKEIVDEFISIQNDHCVNCKVRYLCMNCYCGFAEDGKLRIRKNECREVIRKYERDLNAYIRLKEMGLLKNFS